MSETMDDSSEAGTTIDPSSIPPSSITKKDEKVSMLKSKIEILMHNLSLLTEKLNSQDEQGPPSSTNLSEKPNLLPTDS
uniref:Uncharacterized protein n=1 Tax=Romanomermis culicivorax TaxID=13658 RepID=A0A915L5N4_ROMCU